MTAVAKELFETSSDATWAFTMCISKQRADLRKLANAVEQDDHCVQALAACPAYSCCSRHFGHSY